VWPVTAIRRDGVLHLGGLPVTELARIHGTPSYVVDEQDFRSRARRYVDAFAGADVYYASKAMLSRGIARWVAEEGLGIDVCTGAELEVVQSVGFPPERVTLHGNNKSSDELRRALIAGVGHIVVDSFDEITHLAGLAEELDVRPDVLIRVTVGVEAHTHEFIATAHEDQKFGFSLSSGAALRAARAVLQADSLRLVGLHSHIGSQIFDASGFAVSAHRLVGLLAQIEEEFGVTLAELNLGGGLGIAYVSGDDPATVEDMAAELRSIVVTECATAGLAAPRLSVEPGRAIAGPAGVSLYRVGTIKDVDGIRTYVSVDGGMSDNIRTALYDADFTCVLANRASSAAPMLSRVVGKHCESGDIVVRDVWLPGDLAPGDLLAVAATGAYCRSMASNYNFLGRPPVVAVRDGEDRVLVRRETLDDLLRLDVDDVHTPLGTLRGSVLRYDDPFESVG
jgi:diaminopimelate decarboxylase